MPTSEHQHKRQTRCRVAIIGAGVAGLSAANNLIESRVFAPHDICVLEGSDRIGGRVKTRPFSPALPVPVEIGAAWIHGTQGNPIGDLARTFNVQWKEVSPRNPSLHPSSCDGFQLFAGSTKLSERKVQETWVWQDLLLKKLHALAMESDSWATGKSLAEVVDWLVDNDEQLAPLVNGASDGRERLEFCLREFEAYFGLTTEGLQVDSFVDIDLFDDNPGPHCIVPSGMERIVEGLAESVKDCIRTNTPVLSVDYSDKDTIVLETSSGERIEAEYVVVTSSLGFLKSGRLRFDPALPTEKQAAIDRSKMGQYMKVLLQFPSVFWPEDAVFIGQISDKSVAARNPDGDCLVHFSTFMSHSKIKGYPVLESQVIGDEALRAVSTMTEEELAAEMFRQLQETFSPNIPEPVGSLVTRWDQDKWALGAYSCPTVESSERDPEALRRSIDDRVFFAGEATNHEYLGTLQAAYITGRRRCPSQLKSLRRAEAEADAAARVVSNAAATTAAAAAAELAADMASSDPEVHERFRARVAVVGAGLAGLSAASALVASGRVAARELVVLEGSARVGGRIETRQFSTTLPMNVEIGAAWIHGTQGNPFAALARSLGVDWKEISARNPWLHPSAVPVGGFLMFDGSERLAEAEVQETWVLQQLLMDKLHALAAGGAASADGKPLAAIVDELVADDTELSALVGASATGRRRLELCVRQIEIWMGATAEELQIDDFGDIDLIGDDPGPHCIVPSGMERIVEGLAESVKDCIRTNTPVLSVDYSDKDKVVVETSSGERIEAEYVVVTSSLGFLKSGRLRFDPALPTEKQAAIDRSKMGQYMKVLLQFPSVFWPEDAVFIGQISDKAATPAPEHADKRVYFPAIFNYFFAKGAPVLEAQLVGAKAEHVSETMSDAEIVRAMYLQLQETFGDDIPAPVGHLVTRWDQDPWAIGAYSCLTVDSTEEDPEILRQSVDGRVFFAGEATDYKYQGGLQAAYLTGRHAAADIIASL